MTVGARVFYFLAWAVASNWAAAVSGDHRGVKHGLACTAASSADISAAGGGTSSSIGVGRPASSLASHHKHRRQKGGGEDDDSGSGGTDCAACWPDRFGIVSWVMAAALVLAPIGLSAWLRLKLHKRIMLAMARFAARLLLTGLLLLPIMAYDHVLLTVAYMVLATAIGAAEAASHCDYLYQGEFLHLLVALGTSVAAAVLYAIGFVLPLVWWSDPRYIVPAVTAMLPPAISCCSAGLTAVFAELVEGRERVERALAFGASRHEAGQAVVRAGVRAALERLVQHTSGPGLLLLPALATGLLLAGVPPMLAASYEVVFVLLVGACSAMAAVMAVSAATYRILSTDRLRAELLLPRSDRSIGSAAWFQAEAEQARLRAGSAWRKAAARARVVAAHGAGRGGSDWLRRSFSRGGPRGGGQDADDGASMSSRLREVVMGASDDDAYSALSGGPADHDDLGAEPLPPAPRGSPGRSLSETLRMLPAALSSRASPARSWVGGWAANPFARATDRGPAAGGLALYSEAPSARLYLPPTPGDHAVSSADPSPGGGPPAAGASPHPRRHVAALDVGAAGPGDAAASDDVAAPAGALSPLGQSPTSGSTATEYHSHVDHHSRGGSIADPMSPDRWLRSPVKP